MSRFHRTVCRRPPRHSNRARGRGWARKRQASRRGRRGHRGRGTVAGAPWPGHRGWGPKPGSQARGRGPHPRKRRARRRGADGRLAAHASNLPLVCQIDTGGRQGRVILWKLPRAEAARGQFVLSRSPQEPAGSPSSPLTEPKRPGMSIWQESRWRPVPPAPECRWRRGSRRPTVAADARRPTLPPDLARRLNAGCEAGAGCRARARVCRARARVCRLSAPVSAPLAPGPG